MWTATSPRVVNFQRVADEVGQHLAHALRVELEPGRHLLGDLDAQRHAVLAEGRAGEVEGVMGQALDGGRLGLHGQAAGLEAGQVERVADEPEQLVGAALDELGAS
ncbi:MAG: hypothetical protein U1F43_18220 [Myxococcota bacterium]